MDINSIDKSITTDELISKVDNIYMMLYTSIMTNDIDRVKHKISLSLYEKYKSIIDGYISDNLIHMYDELNIKSTNIKNIEIVNDKIVVTISLVSRYLNYYIAKDTKEYIKGNKVTREEHTNILTLIKNVNFVEESNSHKCPTCGHTIDTSFNGKCSYCGSIYNTEKYDYILDNIEEL